MVTVKMWRTLWVLHDVCHFRACRRGFICFFLMDVRDSKMCVQVSLIKLVPNVYLFQSSVALDTTHIRSHYRSAWSKRLCHCNFCSEYQADYCFLWDLLLVWLEQEAGGGTQNNAQVATTIQDFVCAIQALMGALDAVVLLTRRCVDVHHPPVWELLVGVSKLHFCASRNEARIALRSRQKILRFFYGFHGNAFCSACSCEPLMSHSSSSRG